MPKLEVTGWLKSSEDKIERKEETRTISSLQQLVEEFSCHFITRNVYFNAKLLGTDKRVWEVIVTSLKEELGTDVCTVEEIDEEIWNDVTGEIDLLTDTEVVLDGEEGYGQRALEEINNQIAGLHKLSREIVKNHLDPIKSET